MGISDGGKKKRIEMILSEFRFEYKTNDVFRLMILSDLHFQNPESDIDKLKKDLYSIKDDDNAYIIGNGDWFDAIAVTDPRYSKQSDGTKSAAIINESISMLRCVLDPYKEKILGIGIGNHEAKYIKKCGADPTLLLCELLSSDTHKIKHLGYSAVARFTFDHFSGGKIRSFVYYQHHGWGGGTTTEGYSITKYAKHAKHWRAALHVYGHDHQKVFKELPSRLSLAQNSLSWNEEKEHLVLSGSYLKTLNTGNYPTYSEEKGMHPTPLGCVVVSLKVENKGVVITDAAYI